MKINRYSQMNLNDFDYMFNTFITFESFQTMSRFLEFNIDLSFKTQQIITKDVKGFVYEIDHLQYIIPIQIQSFSTLEA